ncbi:plant cysteine oxidase 1-like [Panicum miliaceum]|uniref:cysteine dioxygenase n=1 Tax=Panicum miliaceum TaxID=4540 RepID=A0A3L6RL35_PANMI|nr:plant cysteine oxidase 1-like [Panicum miliaceum]
MAVAFPPHIMALSKVQRLYDACDVVFASPAAGAPTLGEIRWLQKILDGVEAADVGIDDGEKPSSSDDELSPKGGRFLSARAFTRITYVHIHQCEDFSMGVFCFPAGATLPLHDHPEMVVLSKLLYGSVRVRSYDWAVAAPPRSAARKCGLARVVAADEVRRAPCEASVLFPRSGGNLHAFTAVTPCAILDVLTPPYSEERGRPSTYFTDVPIPSLPGFAFLEETDLPEDFSVAGAPYLGPELTVGSRGGERWRGRRGSGCWWWGAGGSGYLGQHHLATFALAASCLDVAFIHHSQAPPQPVLDAPPSIRAFRVDLRSGDGFEAISARVLRPGNEILCSRSFRLLSAVSHSSRTLPIQPRSSAN